MLRGVREESSAELPFRNKAVLNYWIYVCVHVQVANMENNRPSLFSILTLQYLSLIKCHHNKTQ